MEVSPQGDPYTILGLPRTATAQEIKEAYFRLVKEHSPETDPAQFKLIRAAYERLRTDKARAFTDLFLLHEPPSWSFSKRRTKARVHLTLGKEEVLAAAKAFTDLGRLEAGMKQDFRELNL